MASLKDVARIAGVSIATVSRVVNNLDVVSDAKRRKIEQAIKKVGYNPNLAARSLKRQSTKLLGLLVPDIENPYYATLSKNLEQEASRAGYSLILCNTNGTAWMEIEYLKLLIGRLVDGILLCRSTVSTDACIGASGKPIQTVMLERSNEADNRPSVMVDNTAVGRLMAGHFVGNGHKRFVCITENQKELPFIQRVQAFCGTVAAAGHTVDRVIEAGPSLEGGRDAMMELLGNPKRKRPTAIYCTNDVLAFGVIQAAMLSGIRMPLELSVGGTDDVGQSSYVFPPLTTVAQPYQDIARNAIRLLMLDDVEPEHIVLPPQLVIRQSSGPAPGASAR